MVRYPAVLLALALGLAACEWAWDAANRASLTRDIEEVYPFSESASGNTCDLASAFGTDPSVVVFQSGRRPPELRLKNGGAFEFLLLYH